MIQLVDNLADNWWHLFVVALVLLLAWRIGSRVIGGRPLSEHFPRLTATADLLLLPLLFIVAGTLVRTVARRLGVEEIDPALRNLTLLFGYLALGWALARLIDVWLDRRSGENLGERVPKLITGLIYGTLLFVALAVFLWQEGYSFTGVWVSTGVAAAVLGLALQKTLWDLFSGIALGLERPFSLGDWIELADGTVGEVMDLNWRATRLRGWDNATRVIPSSRMCGSRTARARSSRPSGQARASASPQC